MTSSEDKLDQLIQGQHELMMELRVHLARDEAEWEKVSANEEEIKQLTRDGSSMKTKHAALAATIATALSGGVHLLMKAFV